MIHGIDHVEIVASDAEEMADFLEAIGFEEHRRTDHHRRSYELKPAGSDGPIFEVHTAEEEEIAGVNHVALAVDDVEAAYEELRAAGVPGLVEPYFVESTGRMICNFRDPDGRRFQLVDGGSDAE